MLIFSIYGENESKVELELIRKLKSLPIDSMVKDLHSLDVFVEAIRKKNYEYIRLATCILALNKMSPVLIPNDILIELSRAIKFALETKPKSFSYTFKTEAQSILGLRNHLSTTDRPYSPYLPEKKIHLFTLRPGKSGFFSVIENILNALFIARVHKKKLYVSLEEGEWWIYDCDIRKILTFDDLIFLRTTKALSSLLRFKKQEFYRKYFFSNIERMGNDYTRNKILAYETITQNLRAMHPVNTSTSNTVIYLRQGDKATLEDMKWDTGYQIDLLTNDKTSVYSILSDDIPALRKNLPLRPNVILDEDDNSGYHFGFERPNEHDEIIRKFLLMVDSSELIGDPGSNLINACAWARKSLGKTPLLKNVIFGNHYFYLV